MKDIDEISGDVIDLALRIHRELGPEAMGYLVSRQHPVDIVFDGQRFPVAFRIDLLVDHRLVAEIKSLECLGAVHGKQLLTYLRLIDQPVGLLVNFGGETLKEGVRRVVNNHRSFASPRLRVNQSNGERRCSTSPA